MQDLDRTLGWSDIEIFANFENGHILYAVLQLSNRYILEVQFLKIVTFDRKCACRTRVKIVIFLDIETI